MPVAAGSQFVVSTVIARLVTNKERLTASRVRLGRDLLRTATLSNSVVTEAGVYVMTVGAAIPVGMLMMRVLVVNVYGVSATKV